VTDRSRIAITFATALLLSAQAYGNAVDINPPGVLGDIWDSNAFALIMAGLPILSVFMVYRWWALLVGLAPVVVGVGLYATGYVSPEGEEIDLSSLPWYLIGGIVLLETVGTAAFLSLGLLLRWVWERVRSRRRGGLVGSTELG
jgi:hypothetical protein